MSSKLPEPIAEKIRDLPESSMGAHRVDVVLADGTKVRDVAVAWTDEVVKVGGVDGCSFDAEAVVEVEPHES